MIRFLLGIFLIAFFITPSISQVYTVVKGKVTESQTGTPIPFANVFFSGTREGGITDFDGNYSIVTASKVDSIEVRYIGYLSRKKPIVYGKTQQLDIQLDEDTQTLPELVVFSGENPAFPILRKVEKNKPINDKRRLSAFEYEAYTKIEFDIDNLSEKVQDRKVMAPINQLLDTLDELVGEDGKPILPVLVSEAVSRLYFRTDPTYKHEHIIRTRVAGLGITDGTLTSQIIGASFQEYNFYQNWLNIVNKDFVSPIADGWKLYYDYDLIDSLYIDDIFCYKIDFYPKRTHDLAFQGSMWITKDEYALLRMDAFVPNTANINFIEKIKIQQELFKTESQAWLPLKTRVVIDVSEVTPNTAGFLAKFYISTKDHIINNPKPVEFYYTPVSLSETVALKDEAYWTETRHEPLTESELLMYEMIDTLKKVPFIKRTSDLTIFAATAYYKSGKLDLGPYPVVFGNNSIEGIRLGFGARTNYTFSKKGTIGGYLAYGFMDERFKYQIYGERILERAHWTTLRYEHQHELEQIWLLSENIGQNSLFYTLSRFGNLIKPFLYDKHRLTFSRQLRPGWQQSVELKHQNFLPQFDFAFNSEDGQLLSQFQNSELTLSTRYARDEIFVINDNERLSLGTVRWPAITFTFSFGFNNLLGSDLNYQKYVVRVQKRVKLAWLGVGYFDASSGLIRGAVPYPLLFNTIGNETIAYARFAYNTMNFFEFSSDKYVGVRYRQSFEGFLLNSLPVIKRLDWRLVGNANILYGSISQQNLNLVEYPRLPDGSRDIPFFSLEEKPFIELGYGIENIFKLFRVDAFHRLTYLNHPGISKFQLKFSMQLIL